MSQTPTRPHDPAEPDMYWAGYSGWAAMPALLIGGAVSLAVMFTGPMLASYIQLRVDWTIFTLFWVILIVWVLTSMVWAYRSASFVYRLTPSRLYLDFGMFFRPVPVIDLETIAIVETRAWALRRFFGIGAVILRFADDRPAITLRGIFRPERFARAILDAQSRLREQRKSE